MIVLLDDDSVGYCNNSNDIGDYVSLLVEDDNGYPVEVSGIIKEILEE